MNQRQEALHILCAMLAGREEPRPQKIISFLGVLEAVAPAEQHSVFSAGQEGGGERLLLLVRFITMNTERGSV